MSFCLAASRTLAVPIILTRIVEVGLLITVSIPAIAGGFVFNLKDMIDVQMEHAGPEMSTFGQGVEAALKECFQSAYR